MTINTVKSINVRSSQRVPASGLVVSTGQRRREAAPGRPGSWEVDQEVPGIRS